MADIASKSPIPTQLDLYFIQDFGGILVVWKKQLLSGEPPPPTF